MMTKYLNRKKIARLKEILNIFSAQLSAFHARTGANIPFKIFLNDILDDLEDMFLKGKSSVVWKAVKKYLNPAELRMLDKILISFMENTYTLFAGKSFKKSELKSIKLCYFKMMREKLH